MNRPDLPIHVLIDSIENHGSIHAFEILETVSLDHPPGKFVPTFMIMADKYNNAFASMSVYYQLNRMNYSPQFEDTENGIFVLDSLKRNTRELAIRYLKKAASLGDEEANKHLLEYRKKGIIK